ncbi:MAG TPA: tetratricopeptide repeat protein [Opitutaceae bacterium]
MYSKFYDRRSITAAIGEGFAGSSIRVRCWRAYAVWLSLLGFILLPTLRAQDQDLHGQDSGGRSRKLDPKRIINESKGFLKEREPDLSAEESALYERASEMLATQPELARQLLEGIVNDSKANKLPSPAFDLLLGNIYYTSGAQDKAEASYLKATERYPTFLRAWVDLGVLYYGQKRYEKAIPCYTKAVTLGAREATTFGALAECLEKTGDPIGAEISYIQALASDPGNVAWLDGLLRVYLDAKQYSRAEVMVRNLIHERPGEADYWLTYANIMIATGRKLEAIALLEQTLATGVAGDKEIAELAGLYADEQLFAESLACYAKIKISARTLGEAKTFQLVRVMIAASEWEKAQALLDELGAEVSSEGRREFLQTEAELFMARQQWTSARKVLDELLSSDPMNGRALVSLGHAYVELGDEAHATLAFEAAEHTKDGVRQAHIELANLELRNRHFEKSVSHLETAIALEKSPDLEEILTRVRALLSNDVSQAM